MKNTRWMALIGIALCIVLPLAGQEWQSKGLLLTDSSPDETMIWLDRLADVQPDRLILIESRDGSLRATYAVKHAIDDHIILKRPLDAEFLAGSRVFQ